MKFLLAQWQKMLIKAAGAYAAHYVMRDVLTDLRIPNSP